MTPPQRAAGLRRDSTPQQLRKPVKRPVGEDAGAASTSRSRSASDPTVSQTAFFAGTFADVVGTFRYSVLGGGRIAPETTGCSAHISTEVVPILGPVTCNRAIFPQLGRRWARSSPAGWPTRSTPTSTPAATTRASSPAPPRCPTTPSVWPSTSTCPATSAAPSARSTATVVAIFKTWGFGWGGDWSYTDPMHFELNAIVDPR